MRWFEKGIGSEIGPAMVNGNSFWRSYAIVTTLAAGMVVGPKISRLAPAQAVDGHAKFTEIDAERINIVDHDGKLRMVISNKDRFPAPVMNGKTFHRQGAASPGMIFYNDEGDEDGGLSFDGKTVNGKSEASAALLFDQYKQDQTVGIEYNEEGGKREAGLHVWDRPEIPLDQEAEKIEAIRNMPAGPQKDAAMKELHESAARGEYGATRVFVGKNQNHDAEVLLADAEGKPRLRMTVDAAGNAKVEFLDAAGKVVYSLPPTAQK